jgi:hypothetical protein
MDSDCERLAMLGDVYEVLLLLGVLGRRTKGDVFVLHKQALARLDAGPEFWVVYPLYFPKCSASNSTGIYLFRIYFLRQKAKGGQV